MEISLQDLIDIGKFQKLQDRLNRVSPFPSAIIDLDGKILTATAWQDICTGFHRRNPASERLCLKSDQYIADHLGGADPALSYTCPHGLVDNAMPIVIGGVHYATFFTGQFFLEPPDLEFFRQQAQAYGFDQEAYLEAVRRVPVWSREQLDHYLLFIRELIQVIVESGFKRLREIEHRRELEASEERYRSIVETAMDGFWLTGPDGRLLEVNQAYCEMSGYTRDALLGLKIVDLEAVETPDQVAARMERIAARGGDQFESRHRRRDGSCYDVEVSIRYRDQDGGQYVCFIRDISERKRAEQKLQERERNYRLLVENQTDLVVKVDLDGRFLFVSPSFCQLFGMEERELLGNRFMTLVHEDDREAAGQAMKSLSHPPHTAYLEQRALTRNGWRWLAWLETAVLNENGEINEIIGVGRDETVRIEAEEKLRAEKERFQALFETQLDAIFLLDGRDPPRILDCNRAAGELFGYQSDELIGRTMRQLHADSRHLRAFQHELGVALERQGALRNFSFIMKRRDGTRFPTEHSVVPFTDNGGTRTGWVSTVRDVTEEHNLQRSLQQSQKMESIGRLAGGVAHDLNNLLGPIIGYGEMLQEDLADNDPRQEPVQEIVRAGSMAGDLVRQLLAFSRKQTFTFKPLQLNEVVTGFAKLLRRTIREDIAVEYQLGEGLPPIKADRGQLEQVLMNLLVNAQDAISGIGEIVISSAQEVFEDGFDGQFEQVAPGPYVCLSVHDSGAGMDEATAARVFEPFFTTKGKEKGTGLGLATAYGIVKQHGGFFRVSSVPNKGSTFCFCLPGSTEEVAPVRKSGRRNRSGGRDQAEEILLVEDNDQLRQLISTVLQRRGFRVNSAEDGPAALGLLGEHGDHPDLLITDIIMPGMDGKQLFEKIVTRAPGIRVLYISGYADEIISSRGISGGEEHFLQKPFPMNLLVQKVQEILRGRGPADRTGLERPED